MKIESSLCMLLAMYNNYGIGGISVGYIYRYIKTVSKILYLYVVYCFLFNKKGSQGNG